MKGLGWTQFEYEMASQLVLGDRARDVSITSRESIP